MTICSCYIKGLIRWIWSKNPHNSHHLHDHRYYKLSSAYRFLFRNVSRINIRFFGREKLWMKWGRLRSTVLITRLHFQFSHRYAHTHTHRIQNEAAEQNNLPDRLSDTEKKRLLCEISGVFIFSVIRKNHTLSVRYKGDLQCANKHRSTSHYTTKRGGEWPLSRRRVGSVIAALEDNQVLFVWALISQLKPRLAFCTDAELRSVLSSQRSWEAFWVQICENSNHGFLDEPEAATIHLLNWHWASNQ